MILRKVRKWDWKQEGVPGLSCSLYGSVDFWEDYREVTGRLVVGKIAYALPLPEYGVL